MQEGNNIKPVILFGVLDWGLGHATRTSEIIDNVLKRGYEVKIASSGRAYHFLKKRYGQDRVSKIPALKFAYSKSDKLFELAMLLNFLKLVVNYFLEFFWLKKFLARHRVDLIISDNRFGLFSRKVYSVIISHHIYLLHPKGKRWVEKAMFFWNCLFIRQFDEHWIPDYPGRPNLSGKLSHYWQCHNNVYYIGLLSRFKNVSCQSRSDYDVVCIVSGVEPQRTVFIRKLVDILEKTQYRTLILGGKPEADKVERTGNITLLPHLDDQGFCAVIKGAKLVIARSGYSTVMDLIVLGRTALLVPTPKQTEQEYLAWHLDRQGLFCRTGQKDLTASQLFDFEKNCFVYEQNLKRFKSQFKLL